MKDDSSGDPGVKGDGAQEDVVKDEGAPADEAKQVKDGGAKEEAPAGKKTSKDEGAEAEGEKAEKPKKAAAKKAAPKAEKDEEPKEKAKKAEKKPAKKDEKPKAKKDEQAEAKEPAAKKRAAKKPETAAPVLVRAKAKYVRIAPRKVRLIADQVRGMHIDEARALLAFSPRSAALDIKKLIESAAANAENNHELIADEMLVKEITVDEGPIIKRFRPRAQGRATRINKRTSHITVALSPEE